MARALRKQQPPESDERQPDGSPVDLPGELVIAHLPFSTSAADITCLQGTSIPAHLPQTLHAAARYWSLPAPRSEPG